MFNLLTAALCLLLTVLGVGADEERELAAPRDVRFHSVNLRNRVRWSSGAADGHGNTYTVEYAIYGDAVDVDGSEQVAWRPVEQCDDITQTECDVTEQTGDTEEEYYVRVRANGPNGRSDWAETDRRLKLTDTILGPPQVNVTVVNNNLHVRLSGPFQWRTPGKKRQSMFNIFPHLFYNISVYSNRSRRTESFIHIKEKRLLQHGPLEYTSEYCVRAEVLSVALHLTNTPSDWICVSTPDDPFKFQMLMLMLGGVVPTAICLFVLAAFGSFAYYYICGHKPRLPKSMKDIQPNVDMEGKVQMFQPEKPQPINVIVINNTTLNKGDSKCSYVGSFQPGVSSIVDRPALGVLGNTYASQNFQNTPAAASEGLQSWCGSLSEDYGLVYQEDRNQVISCPYNPNMLPRCVDGVNLYKAQTGTTEEAEQRYEEEEEEEEDRKMQLFCGWDRDTGQLQLDFPLLSRFCPETSETAGTSMTGESGLLACPPFLTSVMVKQASQESADDDPLLKMESEWALQVQSTPE